MKYYFILLISLLIFAVNTFAQVERTESAPSYRLHELTSPEFFAALPDFQAIYYSSYDNLASALIRATEAEYLMRFGENATSDQLLSVFDKLRPEIVSISAREQIAAIDMNTWIARIIDRLLSENPIDFTDVDSIDLHYKFDITVEPYDFDQDGHDEWILDVAYIPFIDQVVYRNYLVAAGTAPNYHIHPLPIPYLTENQTWIHEEYDYGNPEFRDVTGDGQMEWLFLTSKAGPGGPGYVGWETTLYVLGWRDGQIVQLYQGSGHPQNMDDDPALEITTSETTSDNWMCGTNTTKIWDWDGTEYIRQPNVTSQSDCTARQAEEAMWAGQFEAAAAYYETFFEQSTDRWQSHVECLSRCDCVCDAELFTNIYQYFRGRRIIAYALSGNTSRVQELFDEASTYSLQSPFINALMAADKNDAEGLCRAAYTYMDTEFTINHSFEGPHDTILPGIVVPNVRDGWDHRIGFKIDPLRAGCDIRLFDGPPTPTPTFTPTPYPTSTPDPRSDEERLIDWAYVYGKFRAGDYEMALHIAEQAPSRDPIKEAYWLALIYEALNRPNDALKTYTAIYLKYPGTWWAWLAGMHLENAGVDQ